MNQAVKSLLLYLRGRSTGEYVFCNNEGQKIRTFRRAFRNALKRAKIDNFRFHDLRHTFASHLVMNGIDLNTVKELLGHKKIEMTLRYSHVSQDHKTRAVETLGQQMDTIWTPAKIEEKIQKQDFTQPLAIAQ
jgi:site-specific recombinase XerD